MTPAQTYRPEQALPAVDGDAPALVLASKSPARRQMLLNAGLTLTVDAAGVDEAEVKASLRADGADPEEVAETLAELKARRVSPRHPGALVLGADQMLECDGDWFDKPANRDEAHAHLQKLAGRSHRLIASAVLVRDDTRIWHHTDTASLTVRPLGESFVTAYLDTLGDKALESVGAYQLEGLGAQLFSRVAGDYFTVLGLPLLPLLEMLRNHGVVPR